MMEIPSREAFFAIDGFIDDVEASLKCLPLATQYKLSCNLVAPQLQILEETFDFERGPIVESVNHFLSTNTNVDTNVADKVKYLVGLSGDKFDEVAGLGGTIYSCSDEGIQYYRSEMAASALGHLILMCSEPAEEIPNTAAWAISLAWKASLLDPTYKERVLISLQNNSEHL